MSIVFTLAILLGMLPCMSLKAYAAATTDAELLAAFSFITDPSARTVVKVYAGYNTSIYTLTSYYSNGEFSAFQGSHDLLSGTVNIQKSGNKVTITLYRNTKTARIITIDIDKSTVSNTTTGNASTAANIKFNGVDVASYVTGITLDKTEASMIVGGETLTLTPTVAPNDATNKTVTWTSSDADVATVTNGVVSAVAAGTATITATATNGTADTSDDFSTTCTVTVNNPTVTANEGESGEYWATYYNDVMNFTADENTTVFQAALSGDQLTMTPVANREVPAGKAVILKSTAGSITLTPVDYTTATLDGNQLVGTTTAITNPGNAYVLNKGTNGVGFYKLSASGTIGANKAYLTYSGATAREFFGFDVTTGISATQNDNEK